MVRRRLSTRGSGRTVICAAGAIPLRRGLQRSSGTSSGISCWGCLRATKDSMQFGLSESQQILKTNARKFFAAECPMSEVRRIMETPEAHDDKLWKHMAE